MVSWRARESEKQVRCREQNESTSRSMAVPDEGGAGSFRCECGDARCRRLIALTASEYACVRAFANRFAIARDHENPESERVLQENERFATVETVTGEATKLARRSDPRQRGRESRWRQAARSGKPGKAP